jgi:adenylate cyclase
MVTDFMRRGFPISTGVATGFAILVFLLAAGLTATILRQQSKSRGESTVTGDAFAVHGTVSDIVGIAPTATVAGSGGMRVDADAAAPVAEETRLTLMRFLEGIVAAIKDVVPRLDANSTLGLNLVVAGAAEALGDSRNLSPIRTRVLVREALGVVGASSEMVEAFVDALPEHREDPRSRAMIECGRSAMDSHLRGDNLPFQGLLDAFRAWQGSPLNAATGERIVTIMVTMVVKPMTLESTQGNFHADVAMHGHDAIVRVVLATHGGHELRHTGDGIMAVFLNPAGAAQAALDIQRAIAAHNVSAGIAPVVVRIGLNAGAAPGQQGDSSENTVQDAFHACSLAGPGQICVTGAIVSLCEGHGFVFREQAAAVPEGGTPLPPVFEMVWQQDQPVELGGV